jgi:hypothetical protein
MDVFQGLWTLAFVPVFFISLWALVGWDENHSKQLRYAALPAVIISAAGCWFGRPATWTNDVWNEVSGFFEENLWTLVWTVLIGYTFIFALWYLLRGRRKTRTTTAPATPSRVRRFGSWAAKALPWT